MTPFPIGYNPKRNRVLDGLRKPEVSLLAFSAIAYADTLGKVPKDFKMPLRIERETFHKELRARMAAAAEEAFATNQRPFLLLFSHEPYVAFVPDLMMEAELTAFRAAVGLHGIRFAPARARKTAGGWSYGLN